MRSAGQAVRDALAVGVTPAGALPGESYDPSLTPVSAGQAVVGTAVAGGLVFVGNFITGALWGAIIGVGVNLFKGGRRRSSRR